MALDLLSIGVVAVLAILGGIYGVLGQIARLGALLLAAALAAPVGALLRPILQEATSLSAGAVVFLTASLTFFVLLFSFRWVGVRIARKLTPAGAPRGVDRGVGALVGAAQGLLLAWLVASVLLALDDRIGSRFASEGSFIAAAARALPAYSLLLK